MKADTVTFVSGQVSATAGTNSAITAPIVPSDPSSGFATETNLSGATSTTTGSFSSSSGFAYTFTQSFPYDDQTAGTATGEFIAGADTDYTITDPYATSTDIGGDITYDYDAFLYDLNTGMTLYDSNNGGSLTGELVSGNEYEFEAYANMQANTDPSLSYDPSIAFSNAALTPTPENPAPMIPVVLGGLAFFERRQRGSGRRSGAATV